MKKEENYTKKEEKTLKMHLIGLRPARCKLICRGKKLISRKGLGKKIIKMHNIYPCILFKMKII